MKDAGLRPLPTDILLATDLSSQSDRALDRAVQLARQWQATLHIVHAQQPDAIGTWWPVSDNEFIPGEDDAEVVREQIQRDLRGDVDDLRIHVAEGMPANVIVDTARREQCDLIILGVSGPAFSSNTFSTVATRLLHWADCSVLIVKTRPHDAYQNLLVGTDFTAESQQGLEVAAHWFVGSDLTLLHALDIPYRSMLLASGRESQMIRMEQETMQHFIDNTALPELVRERIHTHVVHGFPEAVLQHAVARDGDMLTVIGTMKRGLVFHMLIGSDATRIVRNVPGDVLMIRVGESG